MKKWLALVLVLVLVPTCSLATSVFSTDQYGNRCHTYTKDGETSYNVEPETLPFSLRYNDKEIAVLRADFYQAKIGYGYHPFFHIKLDVSQLTEDEIYWLRKEDLDLFFPFYTPSLYSGTDDITYLSTLYNVLWTDLNEIDIVLYDGDVSRYSFEGYNIFCTLRVKHPNGIVIPFDSSEITIERTDVDLNQTVVLPGDFSNMDSWTYKQLKKSLSEKGLTLE